MNSFDYQHLRRIHQLFAVVPSVFCIVVTLPRHRFSVNQQADIRKHFIEIKYFWRIVVHFCTFFKRLPALVKIIAIKPHDFA